MAILNFADTKGTCYLAYNAKKGEQYKFPDGIIWNVIDSDSSWTTGYKSILIQPESEDKNVTVLAFAGTDSLRDVIADIHQASGVILPLQYTIAHSLSLKYKKQYDNLFLTGHSLGGGLAAYCSVKTRIPANTINPAPLVAAINLKSLGANPQITNYIAGNWEVVSSSPGINPGTDVHVSGTGNGFGRHMLVNVSPDVAFPIVGGTDDLTEIEGIWKVTTNGGNYFYWFKEGGYCKWFYNLPTVLTNYAPVDGKGEYKINGSFVDIKWDSGSKEKWNLPLSEQIQGGTWFANSGTYPINAKKNPSG